MVEFRYDSMPDWPPPKRLATFLKKSAAGDKTAFKELYDATSPTLYGIVRRLIPDRRTATDVLSGIYADIWDNAGEQIKHGQSHQDWMLALAHRHAMEKAYERRQTARQGETHYDDGLIKTVSRQLAELKGDPLFSALGQLSEMDRALFLSAYFYGMPVDRLAAQYDLTERSARIRLRRTLRRLSTLLMT